MLRRFITFAVAFMILAAVRPASAQLYQLRHYGVADGLAHGAVTSIYQDRKGYLWFCTREGLSRFDGYSFVNFGERDGLGHQQVNTVTEDRQGRMWVATNGGGVALFLDEHQGKSTAKFKTFLVVKDTSDDSAKAGNSVNRILCDSQNNLWALTDGGLFRAALSDAELNFAAVKTDPSPDPLEAAWQDTDGNLWFGYGNELLEIRDGQLVNHGPAGEHAIKSVSQNGEGNILVAESDSLHAFSPPTSIETKGVWRQIELRLKPRQKIFSLWPTSLGDLYVGTNGGLIKLAKDAHQTEIDSIMLGPYTVWALAGDRDQNLWISTWANGVYKLSGEMIVNYTDSEGRNLRAADIVNSGGRLEAVLFGDQIADFLEGPTRFLTALEYPPSFDNSVTISHFGDRWVASTLGGHYANFRKLVIRMRNGSELPLSAIASTDEYARGVTIYEDESGTLWVNKGISPGKIFRGRFTQTTRLQLEPVPVEFQQVGYGERMISDRAGGIWIATAEKLCHIRESEFTCLKQTTGLPEVDPRSLLVDSRGWLWIGQRHRGASVTKEPGSKNPSFINYSTQDGLLSDSVWALTEDDDGRVYVGTGKGLNRFDPRNGSWQEFTSKDGLAGDDIKSLYKDQSGNIWIAADSVTRLNPRAESKSLQPPPVYISGLKVAGQELALPATGTSKVTSMELAAARNNVTIDFVGVQFQGEDTLLYQHKLEGADADWSTPNKLRSVNYASLSAGSYRFLVRAINRNGLFSAPAMFEFRVLPPMYLRWWFIALAIILFSGMAFLLYQYRVRQLLKLERVRTRIATDLHDDIGSSLSQIAILSEVTRKHLGEASAEVVTPLARIALLSRESVDAMSDIVWAINPQKDRLSDLTHRMRHFANEVLPARDIEFHFQASGLEHDQKVDADTRRQVFLIFKEAVNNILRHSGCTEVEIEFKNQRTSLELMLRDNGCGFDPGQQHHGHGLTNLQKRAAALGGNLEVNSGSDRGTTVTLKIPHRR